MSSPFNEQFRQAMTEFSEQRAKLQRTQRDLQKAAVTASPKDHLLSVTVGVSGEVKDIKFHRAEYATMAPAELSSILVDTINRAREQAAATAQAAFSSMAGFAATMRDSLAGGSDLEEIFSRLDGRTTTGVPEPGDRDEEGFDGR